MCVTTTTQREASSSGFSCDPSSLHYWRCFCGLFKARATALSRSTSTPLPIVELMLSDLKKPFAPEPFKPFGRTCAHGHDMTREPKKRDQSVGCIFAFSKLATLKTLTHRETGDSRKRSYLQQMPQEKGHILNKMLLLEVDFTNCRMEDGRLVLPVCAQQIRHADSVAQKGKSKKRIRRR